MNGTLIILLTIILAFIVILSAFNISLRLLYRKKTEGKKQYANLIFSK